MDLNVVSKPHERYLPFPLSDLQQAYFLGRTSDFAVGNVGSHAYHEYEIEGLDLDRLQRAWREVVERHDALRTVFTADMQQFVLSDPALPAIGCNDLRECSREQMQARLDESRERMGAFVFNPLQWPLFTLELSMLPDGQTTLHLAIDLLIVDASSMPVIKRDLIQAYLRPGVLATRPLTLTFRDYVMALEQYEQGEEFSAAVGYWERRIGTLPPPPELPYCMPRDTTWRPTFRRTWGGLPAEQWGLVKQRAALMGVTPTAVLLTAFGATLAMYSASKRFLLNLTLNSRPPIHDEIGDVIGDFTSVVILELDFDVARDFADDCRAVQEQLWSDIEHNVAGGLRVIREVSRRQKAPFIVPVVFTSVLGDDLAKAGPDPMTIRRGRRSGQTPQVLLDHLMSEDDGALRFAWNVVEEVFPEGLQAAMWDSYCTMLEAISSAEAGWDRRLTPALAPQQRTQRELINGTDFTPCPATLDGLFLDQAAKTPDALAVQCQDVALSYGQLDRISAALAEQLLACQVRPGQLVGIMMSKGWEQVAAVLGILRAGAAYLPLDPDLPQSRLIHLIGHADVAVLLTEAALREAASQLPVAHVIAVNAALTPSGSATSHLRSARADQLAYVLYTSGSTGVPKGVMIDHAGACNTVLDINARFGVVPADRVLALSSLSFDLSVYDIFGPLAVGAAVVMPTGAEQRDPSAWVTLATQARVTIWNSVPLLLKLFVRECIERELHLPDWRLALASGDWVPLDLFGACRQVNDTLCFVSLGGATEASIWSIFKQVDAVPAAWSSVPYGKPLTRQSMHVFDRHFAPCPHWVAGEIFIGGAGVALGYWRDQARTDAAFVTHPVSGERLYRTGDLGRYLPDGDIEFLGRRDDQVKVRGYRVELGEVEAALMAQAGVRQVAVAVCGAGVDARLNAYVVAVDGVQLVPDALRAALQLTLPVYMVPALVVPLAALPLTANGKLDRKALSQYEQADATREYRAPAPGTETVLAQLWAEVLEVGQVGANDNFFDLGGHSILATKLIARVRQHFDVELPLRSLFEAPTLSNVASQIDKAMAGGACAAADTGAELAAHDDFELFSMSSEDDDFMA